MRYVLELEHTDDGRVAGTLKSEADRVPTAFSGWLELMRLLSAAGAPGPTATEGGSMA